MIANEHHALTQDYTGLTSGHIRPLPVQEAYDAMISAWSDYTFATDVRFYTPEQLTEIRQAAVNADAYYAQVYDLWQVSLQECSCRQFAPDRETLCRACAARNLLKTMEDGDMPF